MTFFKKYIYNLSTITLFKAHCFPKQIRAEQGAFTMEELIFMQNSLSKLTFI